MLARLWLCEQRACRVEAHGLVRVLEEAHDGRRHARVSALLERGERLHLALRIALVLGVHAGEQRDPERKVQTLATLEERTDPRVAPTVVRFLEDANETVRHAAGALLAQAEAQEHRDALLRCFCTEQSVRVRNRILDGFSARGWDVGDKAADVKSRLTTGYTLDRQGIPRRG